MRLSRARAVQLYVQTDGAQARASPSTSATVTILGIGIDLTQIERIEEVHARRGQRFLDRIYTAGEQAYCARRMRSAQSLAGRFAAKEAAMKVLGTGWARGVRWVDIEVVRAPGGPPTLLLHGRAAEHAARRGIERWHLALTHDAGLAVAVAIAEGAGPAAAEAPAAASTGPAPKGR
ncbi:MAG: holo-ACP synthase [Planctomycetota bacterium]|nr:MAG: holo-ACP synthase [Planctomycetota bacterium]